MVTAAAGRDARAPRLGTQRPHDVDQQPAIIAVAHRIVWCTVATVDRRGRPRSRVLRRYWEHTADGLTGWITTLN